MATDTQATTPALARYRLSVRQFEAMCAADVFGDDRVELLGGLLIVMSQYPPHTYVVMQMADALRQILPAGGWDIREEKAVLLGRFWSPQPDVAVVRGPRTSYLARTPRASDLAILIEVADTTYAKDSGAKWRNYAAARVAIYWITNLARRQVEVYTDPAGRGKSATYRGCKVYAPDAEIPVVLDGREVGRIAVKDILP